MSWRIEEGRQKRDDTEPEKRRQKARWVAEFFKSERNFLISFEFFNISVNSHVNVYNLENPELKLLYKLVKLDPPAATVQAAYISLHQNYCHA